MPIPFKLSSDLCAGASLIGAIIAAVFGLLGLLLMFSKNELAKTLIFFLALPAFFFGVITFVAFYRESGRRRQVETEEELIRKLAIEKLERDKLKV